MMFHKEMMQLIIGYAFTGATVFLAVITLLSLVGWVKFADSSQQKKLFTILIVAIVGISVSSFAGLMRFDAANVAKSIEDKGVDEGIAEVGHEFAELLREMPLDQFEELRVFVDNLAARLDEMDSINDVAEFADARKDLAIQFGEFVVRIEDKAIKDSFESANGALEEILQLQEGLQVKPEIDTLILYMNEMNSLEESTILEGTTLRKRLDSFTNESEKLLQSIKLHQ